MKSNRLLELFTATAITLLMQNKLFYFTVLQKCEDARTAFSEKHTSLLTNSQIVWKFEGGSAQLPTNLQLIYLVQFESFGIFALPMA